ncbi:MAG: hypothetical protein J3K34DRAFT_87429 [Monoraphidium minutum]|nr:MAG: hypothetical protein J3K34DRAFT_87429 [Monoraphidium minutum]
MCRPGGCAPRGVMYITARCPGLSGGGRGALSGRRCGARGALACRRLPAILTVVQRGQPGWPLPQGARGARTGGAARQGGGAGLGPRQMGVCVCVGGGWCFRGAPRRRRVRAGRASTRGGWVIAMRVARKVDGRRGDQTPPNRQPSVCWRAHTCMPRTAAAYSEWPGKGRVQC